MATRGRDDGARDFFNKAEREFHDAGINLPASYDAKIRLLENFSPKTLNDDRAVRDWTEMFTMWPTKYTPGCAASSPSPGGQPAARLPASRRRCW